MRTTCHTDLTLDDYQERIAAFANNDLSPSIQLATMALGVAGEAGEVADLVKKHIGHGHPLDDSKLMDELGDVLWYIARLADIRGFPLESVAQRNIRKLEKRYGEKFSVEASINRKE